MHFKISRVIKNLQSFHFTDNLTKVKGSMEALVTKKRNDSQTLLKKTSPFPPSPAIIWVQQGIDTNSISFARRISCVERFEELFFSINQVGPLSKYAISKCMQIF